jgi:hypothetical protein
MSLLGDSVPVATRALERHGAGITTCRPGAVNSPPAGVPYIGGGCANTCRIATISGRARERWANVRPTRILPGIDAPLKRSASPNLPRCMTRD